MIAGSDITDGRTIEYFGIKASNLPLSFILNGPAFTKATFNLPLLLINV
jgi:hypothetical protein